MVGKSDFNENPVVSLDLDLNLGLLSELGLVEIETHTILGQLDNYGFTRHPPPFKSVRFEKCAI